MGLIFFAPFSNLFVKKVVQDLTSGGVNGYRIEPDNIEQLKDALMMSLDSKMEEKARSKDKDLRKQFNFEMMAELYINAIRNQIKIDLR